MNIMRNTFSIKEAKEFANNTNYFIRPINENGERLHYAFYVKDGIMYDTKDRVEKESDWGNHKFIVTKKGKA